MPTTFPPGPGERYTIRRKVFKLFGAGFHIYGPDGAVVGYCKQKAFRLREDLRVYTDDSCTAELFRIGTEQILDIGATYTVTLPSGERLGSFRRKGLKSAFLRDHWMVMNAAGKEVGDLVEDSGMWALLRRYVDYVSLLVPQKYNLFRAGPGKAGKAERGEPVARLRQHFNPFVFRLGVAIEREDAEFDDLLILALACIIAAIEGRQS